MNSIINEALAMAIDIYSHADFKPNGFEACLMAKTAMGLNWQQFHVLINEFRDWYHGE